ncbi:MAG: sulfite exporter TauE/SafE family protein [Acidaminococcaceae bacterium]|jgi:uncharacterized membrane protein YfcA|nr:sulfite exporter TauE/SafE family protein [Acidaminococcaceae bacterium]
MTVTTGLLAVLFLAISMFLETTVGFGFAIVSMPLMSLIMGPKAAVLYVSVAAVLCRPILLWHTRHDWQKPVVGTMFAGIVLGLIPGGYVLKIIADADLKIFFGLLLFVALLLMFYQVRLPVRNLTWGRFLAGVGAGFLGGSTSMAGPPVALWFANEDMPKLNMRANMIWVFTIVNLLTVVVGYCLGTTRELGSGRDLLYILPGLALGFWLGMHYITRINQHLFTRIVQLLVGFGALSLCIGGILAK